MELGSEVGVKNAVNVLQMSTSGVFVKFVRLGIRSVEVSTASRCGSKEVEVLARNKHAPLAHQKS